MLLSASNKRFLGALLGTEVAERPRGDRRRARPRHRARLPGPAGARREGARAASPTCWLRCSRRGRHDAPCTSCGAASRRSLADAVELAGRRSSSATATGRSWSTSIAGDDYEARPLVDAAQTPPFLTEPPRRRRPPRRAIRHARTTSAPLLDYVADPLDTTELVLVAGGTVPRSAPRRGEEAGRARSPTPTRVAPAREWLDEQFDRGGVKLDAARRDLARRRLGEDLGRLLRCSTARATYGPEAKLGADEVEPFLGEAGGVPPWELTDAIDRGDTAARARSAAPHDRRRRPPPAADHGDAAGHYSRDAAPRRRDVTDEKRRGRGCSTSRARPSRREGARQAGGSGRTASRGRTGCWRAPTSTCAGGEWPDELVIEVLVARLARLGVARPGPGGRRPGLLGGQLLHEAGLAPGGLVLVDDALGGGLVEALHGQAQRPRRRPRRRLPACGPPS